MVEIFKTDVQEVDVSKQVMRKLLERFPNYKINFDLEDCDKILRIDAAFIEKGKVNLILESMGYQCEILLD